MQPAYRWTPPGTLSLLREMGRRPATQDRVPQEDQATIMLAWLCDHSQTIARALVESFTRGDDEVAEVLATKPVFAAQFQVRLPPLPGTGLLFADLSLVAPDHAFQLLVEVKLGAAFGEYKLKREVARVVQPDAYIRAWRLCSDGQEARVRRLGTLQVHSNPAGHAGGEWRAADLLWSDVRTLLSTLLDGGELDQDVRLVARDFTGHIGALTLAPVYDASILEHGKDLLDAVCDRLIQIPSGPTRRRKAHVVPASDHSAARLQLQAPNGYHCDFWLGLTPAGTSYNVVGWPTVVQIEAVDYDEEAEIGLRLADFEMVTDRAGYSSLRARLLDTPRPDRAFIEQRDAATDMATALLTQAGLLA